MNFLLKRSQIPPPPGADHGHVRTHAAGLPVFGQQFFKQNSKWWTKLTPVSQVKKVILGKRKLVSIKDVCANCFCASLLRMQIDVASAPRHSLSVRKEDDLSANFARILRQF